MPDSDADGINDFDRSYVLTQPETYNGSILTLTVVQTMSNPHETLMVMEFLMLYDQCPLIARETYNRIPR